MADLRISELAALAGANLAAGDLFAVVDTSASETKKITVQDAIGYGVTLIADATIPGAKILFNAGTIAGSALANSAVGTTQLANDAVTAAKLADESTVDLVTTLPASGAYVGQLALDTDDDKLYCWDGSSWVSLKAAGSINTVVGGTAGIVNLTVAQSGDTVTISTTLDNTSGAAQFLAGPTAGAGAVGYRQIASGDLPTASTGGKGAVLVNGQGLAMSGDQVVIDNTITASGSTYSVVQYSTKGLVTAGRAIAAADLPAATASDIGAIKPGSGLAMGAAGALNHSNAVTAGTATKVTYDAQGHITAGQTLSDTDIPNLPASKITTGTLDINLIGNNAITGNKLADSSTVQFGGASSTAGVVTFPTAEFKGQQFFDALNGDLYLYDGAAWQPITITSGELIYAGTYDASTNKVKSVTAAGSAAGLVVNSALPAASNSNLRYYLVVSDSGTGTAPAPAVALAPPDMIVSGGTTWELIDVSNAIAGQIASNISFTPYGTIAATNVQTALQELDDEKLGASGGTITGSLLIGTAGSLVFEGSTADAYETTLTVVDPTADRTISLPNSTGTLITTGDTGVITSSMIADGTIATGDLADGAVTSAKIADGTIATGDLADGAVTSAKIADGTIVNADVNASAAIAGTKISPDFGSQAITTSGTAAAASFSPSSNTAPANGLFLPGTNTLGFSVNSSEAARITATGGLAIGSTAANANVGLRQAKAITGATTAFAQYVDGAVQTDVTGSAIGIGTSIGTAASAAVSGLVHFQAATGSLGAGSSITTQIGFSASSTLDGATNDYGFYGNIGAGSGNWNCYMVGAAPNYFAGQVQIGAGSAGTPSLSTNGDTNTGIYFPAADSLGLVTGGTERLRVDNSGNIAVNTTSANTAGYGGPVLGMYGPSNAGGNIWLTSDATAAANRAGRIGFGTEGNTTNKEIVRITGLTEGSTASNLGGAVLISTKADGGALTERMRIRQDGSVLVGKTTAYTDGASTAGVDINPLGTLIAVRSGEIGLLINRTSSDGDLVSFRQDGTQEGTISVSGTTVSYNGAHLSRWSQIEGTDQHDPALRPEILRGTVLSNVDEMCEWIDPPTEAVLWAEGEELPEGVSVGDEKEPATPGGPQANEQLNRMKVSDVEGDPNVAGVFQGWDDDDDTYTNDFYCAMTGDFIIRIGAGVVVQRGDLLMSAGDGTAKPQADDLVRSCTVAKVTSTHVSCTYEDGSYCVPCVLMAC